MRKKWVVVLAIVVLLLSACGTDPTESVGSVSEPNRLSETEYEDLVIDDIWDGLIDGLNDMLFATMALDLEWDADLYLEFKAEKYHIFSLAARFSEISPPPKYEEAHEYLALAVEASVEAARLMDEHVEGEDVSESEMVTEIEKFISNSRKAIESFEKTVDDSGFWFF